MSTLSPQIRARLPRLQDAATVRARLSLVPPRAATARRTPFVVLIFAVLAVGVVGLLMFNTQMQQDAFRATALQDEATALTAKEQALGLRMQDYHDPQWLAKRARSLGMVVPQNPAFLRLSDGKVVGEPTMSTTADGMRVGGFPATKPHRLAPPPRIVHVTAKPKTTASTSTNTSTTGKTATGKTTAAHGAASPKTDTSHGKKTG